MLVATFLLGAFLITQAPAPSKPEAKDKTSVTSTEPTKATEPEASEQTQDSEPTTSESAETGPTADPSPIAELATAEVPGSAPPNNDVDGTQVTFGGENLIDGDPETAWRQSGDATGSTITLRFPQEVDVTSVGIINGWAKTTTSTSGTDYDWYHSNRRVLAVEWLINGETYSQTLIDATGYQALDVTPTRTADVQLRIVSVSSPGSVNPRDFTAIAEIAVSGVAD